ncbi:hypothetical protein KBD08_02145 [Candidatus Babeliales bacterium]|nr:hypothetical protein [Candidatus Babeliales bacterium]
MIHWVKYLLVFSFLLLVPVTVHYVQKESPQQTQRHVEFQDKLTRAQMIEEQYQPSEYDEQIPVEYVQMVSPDYDVRVPVQYESTIEQVPSEQKNVGGSSGEYFGFGRSDAGYGNAPSELGYDQPQSYDDQNQSPYYDPGYGAASYRQPQSSGRGTGSSNVQSDSSARTPFSYNVPASKAQSSSYVYPNTRQGGAATQHSKGGMGPYVKPTNVQPKALPKNVAQPAPLPVVQPIQPPTKYFWPKVATALGLGPLLGYLYNWWNQPQATQTAGNSGAKEEPSKNRIEEIEEEVEGDDASEQEESTSENSSGFGAGVLKRYLKYIYPKTPPAPKGSPASGSPQGGPKQPSSPAAAQPSTPQQSASALVPRASLYSHLNLNMALQRITSYFSRRSASALDPSLVTVLPPLPQPALPQPEGAVIDVSVSDRPKTESVWLSALRRSYPALIPDNKRDFLRRLSYGLWAASWAVPAAQTVALLGSNSNNYSESQADPIVLQFGAPVPAEVLLGSSPKTAREALAHWKALGKGPIRLIP